MTSAAIPAQSQAGAGPSHLSNIQILRGLAAAMVLVYHTGNELADRGFEGDWSWFGVGSAGVDVFFVVSGFIMAHSCQSAFGRRGAPWLFLVRRAVRLVPLYWIVTAFTAATVAWTAGLTPERIGWFTASFAFLFYPRRDGSDFPVCAQGWTLNFEVTFYLAFAVALTLKRGIGLAAVALLFTVLAVLGRVVALPWPLTRITDTNTVEFVLGLALAEAERRGLRLTAAQAFGVAAMGGGMFLATVASVDEWLPYRGWVWGPPALAVVAAAALCRPRRTGVARAALEAFGDASYALYLIQSVTFAAFGAVLERFDPIPAVSPGLYGSLCVLGAIASAFAAHHFIERPIARSLGRRLGLNRRWRALTADVIPLRVGRP